jgi:hypothetical protein
MPGFWNKVKEFGKTLWGGVTSVFKKIVQPLAKGPIGTMIQTSTGIPVSTIVNGIGTGIDMVDSFRGTNINNAAQRINNTFGRGRQMYNQYQRGGIDAVLNQPDD